MDHSEADNHDAPSPTSSQMDAASHTKTSHRRRLQQQALGILEGNNHGEISMPDGLTYDC